MKLLPIYFLLSQDIFLLPHIFLKMKNNKIQNVWERHIVSRGGHKNSNVADMFLDVTTPQFIQIIQSNFGEQVLAHCNKTSSKMTIKFKYSPVELGSLVEPVQQFGRMLIILPLLLGKIFGSVIYCGEFCKTNRNKILIRVVSFW